MPFLDAGRHARGAGGDRPIPRKTELTLERLDHLLVDTPPPVARDSVGW